LLDFLSKAVTIKKSKANWEPAPAWLLFLIYPKKPENITFRFEMFFPGNPTWWDNFALSRNKGRHFVDHFSFSPKTKILAFVALAILVLPGAQCGGSSVNARAKVSPITQPLFSGFVAGSGVTISSQLEYVPGGEDEQLWDLINDFRRSRNQNYVQWHQVLAGCATRHTNDMVLHNYLGLVSKQGVDVFNRIISSNPAFFPALAQYFVVQGSTDPQEILDYLASNPVTRGVMANSGWMNIGIGYSPGMGGTWTVVFSTN
jgi:uncharacterized protein YkwD